MRDVWLLLLTFMLGLAFPVIAQQHLASPVLVRPGHEIAGVRLGQSASSMLRRLWPPTETRELPDGMVYMFPRYGLNVYVANGVVRAVSTTSSLMRTGEAIGLGASLDDVRQMYGTQFADALVEGQMGVAYDQHGIAFGFDGGTVSTIIVYAPRVVAASPASAVSASAPGAFFSPVSSTSPTPPAVEAPGESSVSPGAPAGAAAPAAAAAGSGPPSPTYVDPGLVVISRVTSLRPYSAETQFMSVVGYLRYVVREQTGVWLTQGEATRMLQEQRRVRL